MRTNESYPFEIDSYKLKKAALYFRAANHELRQQILLLLHNNGRLPVTTIYHRLQLEQSVASQHLAILRKADLVVSQREGKKVFYSVNYKKMEQLQDLAKHLLNS